MKKGYKFNIIDAVVIVAVIGVLAFVGVKLSGGSQSVVETHTYEYTFTCPEVPEYVYEYIKVDAELSDSDKGDLFGKVTSFEKGESVTYAFNDDGEAVKSSKPDHISVTITAVGEGEQTGAGVKLNKGVYGVGHTITIKAGNAKLAGKISGIKQLD